MTARLIPIGLSLTLAPLFATSLAHAQAPGDYAGPPGPYAPPSEPPPEFVPPPPPPGFVPPPPPVVACACSDCSADVPGTRPARESVMANRWAIGLSAGGMGLASEGTDNTTDFTVGELALRFRVTRHLELELAAGGGRERTADRRDGDLEVAAAMLAARWRFNPEGRWNLFATGGIGGAAIVRHDATDEERSDATHPMVMAGLGIERRFRHFAVQAEARVIAIGARDVDMDDSAAEFRPAAMSTPTVSTTSDDKTLGGGSLSLGLSYYF